MPETNYGKNLAELFPKNPEEHSRILTRFLENFREADDARTERANRWKQMYRAYRSYVDKRPPGSWESRLFLPESFKQVETILPRLVAQLPRFRCEPVGEEDVQPAEVMEFLLNHSAETSGLYIELTSCFKDALIYGTGILKVFRGDILETATRTVPVMEDIVTQIAEPLIDPDTGQPLLDPDGNPVLDTRDEVVGQMPIGYEVEQYDRVAYDGPMAKALDPFNFWIAPEAEEVDPARYTFDRSFLDKEEVQDRIEQGIYHWPEFDADRSSGSYEDIPSIERLAEIGLTNAGLPLGKFEALECWTKRGMQITVLNRQVVVRVQKNPFWHKQKPYIRFVNYPMPHEFYGIGEVEAISGLQNAINAIQNRRLDEVVLKLHQPTAVNPDLLHSLDDLIRKPGQVIRTRGDIPSKDVLSTIDLGDVNSSAYVEVDHLKQSIQETTGVSNVQQGLESTQSETATGTAILQEMGSTRFGFKSRLFELGALKRLGKQMGSILQQFTPKERVIRLLGPAGEYMFQNVDPLAIQGALDYSIETSSIIQSETVKREQAMGLFNILYPVLAQLPPGVPLPPGITALVEDILEAFGKKQKGRYLAPSPMMPGLPSGQSEVPQEPMAPSPEAMQ